MKKIVYMLSAVIIVVLAYLSIPYVFFSSQEAAAIGIIGGADGPTALLGILIVIGIIFFRKR